MAAPPDDGPGHWKYFIKQFKIPLVIIYTRELAAYMIQTFA